METTGFYNQGGGEIEYVDPAKITAGQKYNTGLVFIYPATSNAIDDVDALFTGWIVFNENVNRWQEAGQEAIKGNWDASTGTLPSTNVISGDKYIISVAGLVNGIQLNENDTITAKTNNPTDSETGGIFDDWTVVGAITITSINVSRPNGDNVENSLVNLQNNKVDIVAGKQLSTEDYTTAEKNKLLGIASGAEVNVQSDYNQTDNTQDDFIKNKPNLGTVANKDVGNQIGEIQENGAILGNSQTVETDATGKFITVNKNTAYNKNFGTTNGDVARGDASYLKASTYTKTEANALLTTKEATANKGVANGYASLNSDAQVPLSQLPANAKSSKVVADIAARDAIASADRFEGLRVHVLNATADTTISSGSAGYILKSGLANTDWEKTYESESLDIDLSDYFNKTTDTTDNITEGTSKFITQADIDKLAGIEANATTDQTAAEIKTAYESNADTNAFTDAEKTKLAGIEQNATADQSDLEIKTAYENNVNTNAFTDAEKTKLASQSGTNTGDETTSSIQIKRPLKTIEGQSLDGAGNIDLTKANVGLDNVDNTSDADKPVSTAQQTALNTKLAKASNLSDVTNRQTALDNLTDVANASNEQVLFKDTASGNAKFKNLPGISSQAYASVSSTALLTSATTLAPLSGTNITNSSRQFTIGSSSITCNKTGLYQIIVSGSVEASATNSVPITLFVNSTNVGQPRYDLSTANATGYYAPFAASDAVQISNNDVITVSKNLVNDAWKTIFVTIVEII